jgi:N-acetylglucosaminyldiphosphoundecaprenol N-acetyl-beta-D-mannosaminyltransferase
LGVGISVLNLHTVLDALQAAMESGLRGYVTVTGVHGVIESQDDEALLRIHNDSLLSTPDGMPMVWMGKLAGYQEMSRVYGPDLMPAVLEWSTPRGYTHFFYGGKEGVAERLKTVVEKRYPGINVVGVYSPPFRPLTEAELAELKEQVHRAKPDFFWVGMSGPKQERFMAAHLDLLDARIFLGVGAAFDFLTGNVRQAPRWIQRSGFEWLYRTFQEPRRLAKRYFKTVPRFIWLATWQLAGLRKYPPVPHQEARKPSRS